MFSCPHVFKKKHVILFSCLQKKHVLMFSCPHVLKKHVLLFSCLKKTCSLVKQMACVVRFGDRTSYYISYLKSVIIKNQRKI